MPVLPPTRNLIYLLTQKTNLSSPRLIAGEAMVDEANNVLDAGVTIAAEGDRAVEGTGRKM
ncbi:hypothetical protein U1Q18_049544 [Sarracenia purpurea var. burkii]